MWPGYGDNSRVLAWIFDRCDNKDVAVETEIGYMPKDGAINVDGLDVSAETMKELLSVDVEGWKKELADIKANHYPKFDNMPKELLAELAALEERLNK
jgi:phosphoenolpyruvate carboxykinase (GTP)